MCDLCTNFTKKKKPDVIICGPSTNGSTTAILWKKGNRYKLVWNWRTVIYIRRRISVVVLLKRYAIYCDWRINRHNPLLFLRQVACPWLNVAAFKDSLKMFHCRVTVFAFGSMVFRVSVMSWVSSHPRLTQTMSSVTVFRGSSFTQ